MYYLEKEITERASQVEGFVSIPSEYWIAIIRRNLDEQKPNEFNDIAYLMRGNREILNTTCTSVPGLPALKGGYRKYNKNGACVLKADIWMNDAFSYGLHSGRMPSLRQTKFVWSYRDGDNDSKAEQLGKPVFGMWNTNFHASTYRFFDKLIRKYVGNWSYGCIVCNNRQDYNVIIGNCKDQESVSIVILDEFSI